METASRKNEQKEQARQREREQLSQQSKQENKQASKETNQASRTGEQVEHFKPSGEERKAVNPASRKEGRSSYARIVKQKKKEQFRYAS